MFLSNRGSFRPETSGAYTLRRRGRRRPKSGSAIGACAVARLAGSGGPIGDYYGSANTVLKAGAPALTNAEAAGCASRLEGAFGAAAACAALGLARSTYYYQLDALTSPSAPPDGTAGEVERAFRVDGNSSRGLLALPQNQPNAPLYPAGGAPGSRPGALPHFGRPRYLGPPPRARSTAG